MYPSMLEHFKLTAKEAHARGELGYGSFSVCPIAIHAAAQGLSAIGKRMITAYAERAGTTLATLDRFADDYDHRVRAGQDRAEAACETADEVFGS